MGRLDAITDMTGRLNPMDLNAQNIANIIDEMNRNSDQLDSIANSLNIIGRGTLSGTWGGTGGAGGSLIVSAAHGFAVAPIFLAFFTRADDATNGKSYPVPQWFYDSAGSFVGRAYAYTDNTNIYFSYTAAANGSPIAFVCSYYLIQQPAQVPTGS